MNIPFVNPFKIGIYILHNLNLVKAKNRPLGVLGSCIVLEMRIVPRDSLSVLITLSFYRPLQFSYKVLFYLLSSSFLLMFFFLLLHRFI